MKQHYTKKVLAFVLTLAMVLSGASASVLTSAVSASAKAKKVTLKLSKTKLSVQAGKTKTLKIKKKNVKKIKSQKWSSSKKAVATVSKKGKVTAKKAGKATIKVKVKYIAKGSKKVKSKTLKCTVTVTAKSAAKVTATPGSGNGTADVPKTSETPSTPNTPATPTPSPTVDPDKVLITGTVTKDNTTLRMTHDDGTNISDTPITTTVPGGTIEITKKDNGVMRTDITAQELASTAMGTGINVGNTLEATYGVQNKYTIIAGTDETRYDSAWDQPKLTQEYFDTLHSYGINTVRIPVAWSNGDSDDGTYQIDEKLLARVEEVANYALNNGMYVIINDHWDDQWWGQFGACKKVDRLDEDGNVILDSKGNPRQEKVADEETRAKAWARYEAYWTQIANRFKDYSDHVILEGANEEIGSRLNDGIYSTGYSSTTDANDTMVTGNLKTDELYETANKINQLFVDTVRGTGGNNESRFLLIPGYNTNIVNTADSRYVMPQDTEANGTDRLFVSVHYYTPWDFCGDGGAGEYTLADQQELPNSFEPLQRFVDEGYALVLGECGVCSPQTVNGSVTKWFEDTFAESRKYYMVPCLWETGQYFDRSSATLKFKDVAIFFNAVNDANGDTSMTKNTGATGELDNVVGVEDKTPVWSWTGKWYKNGGDYIVGDDRFAEGGGTKVVYDGKTDLTPYFIPESNTEATIEGDATTISFDQTGYQAFIKLDVSKYKKPAIRFTFSEDSLDEYEDGENYVGSAQLGVNSEASFKEDVAIAYSYFSDRAIILENELQLSEDKPYLTIAFTNKPTVTGMYIYDLEE